MQRRFVLQVLGGALLSVSSCCKSGVGDSELAVAEFHRHYNASDHSAIWGAADDAFKSATTEADFAAFLGAVHRKLGDHNASTIQRTNVRSGTGGTSVSQILASEFAGGKATESFNWRLVGGHAVLLGYNINSPTLVLK